MNENQNQAKGVTCLFLAALIWGVAFVAQSVGMEYIGPFTFNAVRSLIGAIVLIPVIFLFRRGREVKTEGEVQQSRMTAGDWKVLIKGGLVCGVFLCIASNLQQVGLQYTSVGKAGFITALYIVGVPVFGIFLGKKAGLRIWISVGIAVVGLYLLCINEKMTINGGDLLELACAAAFAFQIMAVDHYSRLTNGTMLACAEFCVSGLLTLIPMFLTENVEWSGLWAARIPLLYAGVMSCGVAYTLQIIGQKELKPELAALIMSFEAVISLIAGWLLLGQHLTAKELVGCVIMFAAILLAQMPERTDSQPLDSQPREVNR